MFQDLIIQLPNMFLMSSGEWLESLNFLGVDLVDFDDFAELLMRFVFNMSVLLVLVRGIYLYYNTRRNYSFSFIAVGGVVFLLCYLLNNVKLELGFALGLFAIFGIIRYRTDAIPFKQMTYLFVVIGVSVMNALASKKVSYAELLFTNFAVISGLWLLERYLSRRQEGSMRIVYENIANVNQQRYAELLQDLRVRTGFNIKHFEIDSIDYMRDSAVVIVYFDTTDNNFSIDENN